MARLSTVLSSLYVAVSITVELLTTPLPIGPRGRCSTSGGVELVGGRFNEEPLFLDRSFRVFDHRLVNQTQGDLIGTGFDGLSGFLHIGNGTLKNPEHNLFDN